MAKDREMSQEAFQGRGAHKILARVGEPKYGKIRRGELCGDTIGYKC